MFSRLTHKFTSRKSTIPRTSSTTIPFPSHDPFPSLHGSRIHNLHKLYRREPISPTPYKPISRFHRCKPSIDSTNHHHQKLNLSRQNLMFLLDGQTHRIMSRKKSHSTPSNFEFSQPAMPNFTVFICIKLSISIVNVQYLSSAITLLE